MDYKNQCLCGSKELFNQKFRVYLTYDTQQFRIRNNLGYAKSVEQWKCYLVIIMMKNVSIWILHNIRKVEKMEGDNNEN